MANTPSKTIMVAAVGIAIAALFILNTLAQRIDPAYQERMEKEKQAAAMQQQEQQHGHEDGKNSPLDQPTGEENNLVTLGDEKILGNKDAKTEIVIGWEWTPAVQGDPTKVYNAIAAAQKAAPNARIRVVNTDANPDVSLGVFVGGRPVAPPAPDGSLIVDPRTLETAVGAIEHSQQGNGITPPPDTTAVPSPGPAASPAASPAAGTPPATKP
jgi:hypothetical protein